MMLLKAIEEDKSLEARAKAGAGLVVQYTTAHNKGNCPAYGKKCQKCGRDKHFKAVCKNGSNSNEGSSKRDHSKQRFKKGKGKSFMKLAKTMKGSWMISLSRYNHYFTMMYDSMLSTQECTPMLSVRPQMENAVRIHSKLILGPMAILCQFLCSLNYSAK